MALGIQAAAAASRQIMRSFDANRALLIFMTVAF